MTDAVKMAIEALRTLIPEVPRLGERDDYADDFLLHIPVTSGEMRAARKTLAALEQAGEPVADVCPECGGSGEIFSHADNCYSDDCALALGIDDCDGQVVPCPCVPAPLPTLQRLGQEFDAGEAKPVAYRFVHLDYAGRKVSRYGAQPERVNGHDPIETHPLYAHPPQSRVAAEPVGLRDDEGELVATARRNIRTFISAASFNSENDRQAAIACIDVLEDHMNGLGDLVAVLRSAFDAASSLATPAQPDPQSRGQAFDGEGLREALLHIRSELALFAACCAVSNKANDTFAGSEVKAKEWVAYINACLATPSQPEPQSRGHGDYHEGWEEGFKAARGQAFDDEGEARS